LVKNWPGASSSEKRATGAGTGAAGGFANQTTAPIVASALYHAEVMSHGLSNLAKKLGG